MYNPKTPPKVPKDLLYTLYIVEEKSLRDIAVELNVNYQTVSNYLEYYNVPRRTVTDSKRTNNYSNKRKLILPFKNNPEKHPRLGKHLTEESKQKISESKKKYFTNNPHPNLGKSMSNEQKEKISKFRKKYYEEHPEVKEYLSIKQMEFVKSVKSHCTSKHGSYFSSKLNKELKYRSTFEKKAYELLDEDANVINYLPEPFVLSYEYEGVLHKYLPDILVRYIDCDLLVEVKSDYIMNRYKNKNEAKIHSALKYCNSNNIKFQIWNEKVIFKNHKPMNLN